MALHRVNCAWQNWPGAPGVTTLWVNDATQAKIDAMRTFFNSIAGLIPSGLTIQVPSSGDEIDLSDGSIVNSWSVGSTPAVVSGTGAGAYAGNSGLVIHWLTTIVLRGRRLRGRSFIVPVVSTAFETNGSPTSAAITTLTNAGTALVTAIGSSFVAYSRPVKAHTVYDKKTGTPTNIAARSGSTATISSVRVPDLAISLRSRRV